MEIETFNSLSQLSLRLGIEAEDLQYVFETFCTDKHLIKLKDQQISNILNINNTKTQKTKYGDTYLIYDKENILNIFQIHN